MVPKSNMFPDLIQWSIAIAIYSLLLVSLLKLRKQPELILDLKGIVLLAIRAIYNVYYHPLSSFPGPRLAASSDIPYVNASARGKLPHWISSLHSLYKSPIIRISPNELSYIRADAWEDIYSNHHGHDAFDRDVLVYGTPPNGVHSLLTAPKEDHKRMRRVLDHGFSDRALREQEPIVSSYIDNLIQRLHEQIHGPQKGEVNLVQWYNWTSFDIIGDLSFGKSFDCLEKQTYHPWVEMIFGNLKGFTLLSACNRFALLRHLLPYLIPKHIIQMIDEHWATTIKNIDRRVELGRDRTDFISPILEHMDQAKMTLSQDELRSNASLFIIAGSESVATVLSGTTYYLLQNPEIMQKLINELDSTYSTQDQITPQSVSRLPYLQACLSETNRIYPTALTGQAMRVSSAGSVVCGQWIPGGVRSLFLCIYITKSSDNACFDSVLTSYSLPHCGS